MDSYSHYRVYIELIAKEIALPFFMSSGVDLTVLSIVSVLVCCQAFRKHSKVVHSHAVIETIVFFGGPDAIHS